MANNPFSLNVDFSQFQQQLEKLLNIEPIINKSIEVLAAQAYGAALQKVQEKLRSTRNIYLENLALEKKNQGKDPIYIIVLREKALWIEEGVPAHNLKKTHLKKRNSVIIPFQHNKNQPSLMSEKQQQIYKEIKTVLRKEKISLAKPILNNSGAPIISTVKKITPAAIITNIPSQFKSKSSGESILNNLNVYQHQINTKQGTKVQKTLMTFRTLNKKSSGWDIPTLPAAKILDQTYQWILENYLKIIMEQLMRINLT